MPELPRGLLPDPQPDVASPVGQHRQPRAVGRPDRRPVAYAVGAPLGEIPGGAHRQLDQPDVGSIIAREGTLCVQRHGFFRPLQHVGERPAVRGKAEGAAVAAPDLLDAEEIVDRQCPHTRTLLALIAAQHPCFCCAYLMGLIPSLRPLSGKDSADSLPLLSCDVLELHPDWESERPLASGSATASGRCSGG